ncbi:hypothetical protein L9F63_024711, partial [Diploptera punctata]
VYLFFCLVCLSISLFCICILSVSDKHYEVLFTELLPALPLLDYAGSSGSVLCHLRKRRCLTEVFRYHHTSHQAGCTNCSLRNTIIAISAFFTDCHFHIMPLFPKLASGCYE